MPAKIHPKVTAAQLATQLGVSRAAVYKAAETGRITYMTIDGQKMFDSVKAQRQWADNADLRHADRVRRNNIVHNARQARIAETGEDSLQDESMPGEDIDFDSLPDNQQLTLAQAMAMERNYKARLAKLQFLEKQGDLVSREKQERQAFSLARGVRDAVMAVPDRIDSELAAITNNLELNIRLKKELNQALAALVQAQEEEGDDGL